MQNEGLLLGLPERAVEPEFLNPFQQYEAQYDHPRYRSNNWRRMHGYPLHRKGSGRKKARPRRPYLFIDEGFMFIKNNAEAREFYQRVIQNSRGRSFSYECTQSLALTTTKGD